MLWPPPGNSIVGRVAANGTVGNGAGIAPAIGAAPGASPEGAVGSGGGTASEDGAVGGGGGTSTLNAGPRTNGAIRGASPEGAVGTGGARAAR